jgi:hypothetical protein
MTTIEQKKAETVVRSLSAPDVAPGRRADPDVAQPHEGLRVVARAGRLLRRGYERACSAIFDSEDDCMRL